MPHVTFVHGICNKPPEEELKGIWRRALAFDQGVDLDAEGITHSMIYWADVLYPQPIKQGETHESTGDEIATGNTDEDASWREGLDEGEKAFVNGLAAKLNVDAASPQGDDFEAPPNPEDASFERIPVPWFIKRRVMKCFLRDVHHYLFNTDFSAREGESYKVQDEIRDRFVRTVQQDKEQNDGGPHIVVSHSMGTVIAYDCLKRVPSCPRVDGLMTIGSPLGLDEVQDKLKPGWSRKDGFPSERVQGDWVNVYDLLDPVAGLDPKIANDYRKQGQKVVSDLNEQNFGKWRHDITNYLMGEQLRGTLRGLLNL